MWPQNIREPLILYVALYGIDRTTFFFFRADRMMLFPYPECYDQSFTVTSGSEHKNFAKPLPAKVLLHRYFSTPYRLHEAVCPELED